MEKNTQINPYHHIYKPGVKVEIDGEFLSELIQFANKVIDETTETSFTDKLKYVNVENNKTVAKPKKEDLASGKVVQVVDIEKTLQGKPIYHRKAITLQAISTNLRLQSIHMNAIKEGKAIHYEELQKEQTVNEPQLVVEP